MKRAVLIVLFVSAALAFVAGCSCTPGTADGHPAAIMIAELLRLRADDVRDAEAYAPYFLESGLATALAEDSSVETGTPRVPDWEPPYVSAETSTTADVVVVWKPSVDFPDWPAVNVFKTELADGRWVVVDAEEATTAPEPLPRSSD